MQHARKRLAMAVVAAFGVAFAAGDRVIEPVPNPGEARLAAEGRAQYVGSGRMRFVQVGLPLYAVIGGGPMLVNAAYLSDNGPAKGLRLTPLSGGSSVLVNLERVTTTPPQLEVQATPQYYLTFWLDPADFGPNPGEGVAYRAVLVDQNGQEGEPTVLALNFRSIRDFRDDPRVVAARERAKEPLEDVVAVGFYQALGESSLSVYSIESFRSYSRVRVAMRFPSGYSLDWNVRWIQRSLEEGRVTARDDTGQRYRIGFGADARFVRDANALEFSLLMTPRLTPGARRGFFKIGPIPDRTENGYVVAVDEPFRSGIELPIEVKR